MLLATRMISGNSSRSFSAFCAFRGESTTVSGNFPRRLHRPGMQIDANCIWTLKGFQALDTLFPIATSKPALVVMLPWISVISIWHFGFNVQWQTQINPSTPSTHPHLEQLQRQWCQLPKPQFWACSPWRGQTTESIHVVFKCPLLIKDDGIMWTSKSNGKSLNRLAIEVSSQ